MSKERVNKVINLCDKGLINETEMWQELLEICVYELNKGESK